MAYGTVNADVIQSSVSGVSLGAGNATVFKNRIINGAMVINQRGFSGTSAASNYTLDRWETNSSQASKFTVSQNAGSVTPPAGFINYLGVTSSSAYSVAAGDYFNVIQKIEGLNVADLGWGTANAKTVTLSFQVYSSLTGTFSGAICNSGFARSYPFTYTISSANTWTTISVTIAGDTSGTWLTTNGIGMYVIFSLGTGSTYSGTAGSWASASYFAATGATSVVGTNGATFYITGVQLEVGSSATGFEYRDISTESRLCYRYYQKLGNTSYGTVGTGIISNDRLGCAVYMRMLSDMRAAPTCSQSSLIVTDRLGYDTDITSLLSINTSTTTAWAFFTHSATGTAYYPTFVAAKNGTTGYFTFSAEL